MHAPNTRGFPKVSISMVCGRLDAIMSFAEDIERFSDGEIDDVDDSNENLKCYMLCMFVKLEKFEASLEVEIFDWFSDDIFEVVLNMTKQCSNVDGETQCDFAYNLNKCWKRADPVVRNPSSTSAPVVSIRTSTIL